MYVCMGRYRHTNKQNHHLWPLYQPPVPHPLHALLRAQRRQRRLPCLAGGVRGVVEVEVDAVVVACHVSDFCDGGGGGHFVVVVVVAFVM
jgi:hypothetical protein